MGGISSSIENFLGSDKIPTIRGRPNLVRIRVRVLRADMGFSSNFMGNETSYQLKPLKGALIVLEDYPMISEDHTTVLATHLKTPRNYGFTGSDGTVILTAPKGDITLMVAENPEYLKLSDFWKTKIRAEEGKTYTVKIFLYRLKPVSIKVEGKPFKLKTHLTMRFNLPRFGKYHVGYTLISYYDIWLRSKLCREDAALSIPMDQTINPYEMFRMRYSEIYEGGVSLTKLLEINDLTTYVIPNMTYLPVERIILEENES
ncbi:MAG: hypothetical protein DRN68_06180 [Thaumarchaeota archaeon]|nr:MAG: hypothetical protein DRN68_06180 [Nitrososphaerota archaeon]